MLPVLGEWIKFGSCLSLFIDMVTLLTEQEARKLIINCVDDFLEAVNNDEQLRPFLRDFPFTAKNLDLTILNFDKNQELHSFPFIAIVTDSRGKIGFLTERRITNMDIKQTKKKHMMRLLLFSKKKNKPNFKLTIE